MPLFANRIAQILPEKPTGEILAFDRGLYRGKSCEIFVFIPLRGGIRGKFRGSFPTRLQIAEAAKKEKRRTARKYPNSRSANRLPLPSRLAREALSERSTRCARVCVSKVRRHRVRTHKLVKICNTRDTRNVCASTFAGRQKIS